MPAPLDLRDELRRRATGLGLDALGIAPADAVPETSGRLMQALAAGYHGDMTWLADTSARRAAPAALWPEARSVIMLAHSYAPATDPLAALADPTRGVVSCYAKGRDYHDVLKGRIRLLAQDVARLTGHDVKIFVDTAPLMEKPLAAAAGIGWQGKHTNLVSRTHGSWLFLGAILTTAELAPDTPEPDHCGSCRRCLDACPTDAFPAPYVLDARRCIAYLTIEYKGHIPRAIRPAIANRVFGCDDCLAVCPWNKFAEATRELRYQSRAETDDPPLAELLALDDRAFRVRFAGTPVKRTGRDRIVRNALIAAANSADPALVPFVRDLLADSSPLVRAMAAWAIWRLCPPDAAAALRDRHVVRETDPTVRLEWLEPDVSFTSSPPEPIPR